MMPPVDELYACPACGTLAWETGPRGGNSLGALQWSDGKIVGPMWENDLRLRRCPGCRALVWIDHAPVPRPVRYAAVGISKVGPARAKVIQAWRRLTRRPLADIAGALSDLPRVVEFEDEASAAALHAALVEAGAEAQLIPSDHDEDWATLPAAPDPSRRFTRATTLELFDALPDAGDREKDVRRWLLWVANDPDRRRWSAARRWPGARARWSDEDRDNARALAGLLNLDDAQERFVYADIRRVDGAPSGDIEALVAPLSGPWRPFVSLVRGLLKDDTRIVAPLTVPGDRAIIRL